MEFENLTKQHKMKRLTLFFLLFLNAVCVKAQRAYHPPAPDSISIADLMKRKDIDISPNFEKFIITNISLKVKLLCFSYLGKREYRKLVNFALPKDMTGQKMLEIYKPKIFDLDILYRYSEEYLKHSFIYKNTTNIFFARKHGMIYVVTGIFKHGKWHVDAYEADEPFKWLAGARLNI